MYNLYPFWDEEDDLGGGQLEESHEENTNETDEGQEDKALLKDDRVPLAKYLEEKKRNKELSKRIREHEEKSIDSDVQETRNKIKQKYIDKGYDPELADMLAEDISGVTAELKKSKLKDLDDSTLEDDLKELAKDELFKDAPTYAKEIKTKISEFKAKGIEISPEDAYIALRGKSRMKEIQTDIEQKAALKRRENEDKVVPSSASTSSKNPYPLDDTDKKALAGLQKADPKGGWNAEKYWKLRHS